MAAQSLHRAVSTGISSAAKCVCIIAAPHVPSNASSIVAGRAVRQLTLQRTGDCSSQSEAGICRPHANGGRARRWRSPPEPDASAMTESADINLKQVEVKRPALHQDLARRSVHGAAATILSQGIRFVIQFGAQVALARMLLPAEFGIVAMTTPLVGFVQILTDLGLLQATVQQ